MEQNSIEIKNNSSKKIVTYDAHKLKSILDITFNNYSHMKKRLQRRENFSNYILVYYSICVILYSLTGKYFYKYFNIILGEYFGIVFSIILLAYSLINNSANYATRIAKLEKSMNALKSLKRNLDDSKIYEQKIEYNKIVDNVEVRQDVDFFITVRNLCKEKNISCLETPFFHSSQKSNINSKIENTKLNSELEELHKIKNYLSEINPWFEYSKILIEFFLYFLLIILPIFIGILCFIIKP